MTDRTDRLYNRYAKATTAPEQMEAMAEVLASFSHDPMGLVMFLFPWATPGTALENESGPDDWQREEMEAIGEHLRQTPHEPFRSSTASGHGIGKLNHYNDLAITPSGITRWGDLQQGDLLFGADGAPTRILQTHHFADCPMMRVTFDDGSSVDVSTGHLWNVRGRRERRRALLGWRTLETCEIARLGVKRPNGVAEARQWEIPIQGAAQFDARSVPLHPYLVGVWIGDGSKGEARYTKPCPEVADRLRSLGYAVTDHADGKGHGILNIRHLMSDLLFDCGSHDRFIPEDYKINTVEARRALLDGLLDTDGEVHGSGSIGYSTTSERLAHDVIWLARSLGCKAMMQPTVKRGRYRGDDGEIVECRDCWRVTINAPFNPFTHPAKRAAYKPSEARYLSRWIDSIEPIEPMDGMCVTVEAPDGLYLTRDFLVTHNSAETSWIILWAALTITNARGVVTANSDTQLRTKTWAELAKWWTMACAEHPILRELFTITATAFYQVGNEKTWRIDAIPNNPRNPAAFAGLHNAGSRVLVVVDEASEIEDPIWDTIEGAMTDADTEILLLAYGNPTKNTGRFKENTIGRFRHLWRTKQVDSRTVKRTNKKLIQSWIDAWGEASDFVKVRVRGMFPSVGSMQLIGSELVQAAREREPAYIPSDPLIYGLDVARYGDDASVLAKRRGRDLKSMPRKRWRGVDTMTLASAVAEEALREQPDAIFVDVGGVGAGVYDRLVQLKVRNVYPVNFGSPGGSVGWNGVDVITANLRATMWCSLRDWLALGSIEDDPDVEADLTGVEYGFTAAGAVLLESKQHMKARGLASPDDGDAYALTFAYPVGPRRVASSAAEISAVSGGHLVGMVNDRYDPYDEVR